MDFIQEMGIKDLEHVVLKAKNYISIGPYNFVPGEPVLYFRNIQVALLTENTQIITARGGYLNQPRVIWEDRNDTTFQFSNGTLNPISLNMLLGANILQQVDVSIPVQEIVEIENGKIYLSHDIDFSKKRFYKTFEAENIQHQRTLRPIEEINNIVTFEDAISGVDIIADYYFKPKNQAIRYVMNRERKPNLYSLEATFYLKDENNGLLHTGILEMPKIYITSNINLRMGERADPTVGTFRIVAMPDNLEGSEHTVCRITYLDEDIYGI